MDARIFSHFKSVFVVVCLLPVAVGAQYETKNFVILNAPSEELARTFGETAEQCRHDLSILWLGKPMPNWSGKCPITVRIGENLGAGGSTSFVFQGGEVYGWEMDIQGSAQRIVDCVLPHEITHMILASHFRRPVPRWLDEGAATSVEHDSEKDNYRRMLRQFLRKDVRKCLPFNRMVSLKEYPSDVMPFYAQGFSVVEYLLALEGHRRLVLFAESAVKSGDWASALREHYGLENLGDFQEHWVAWISSGSPSSPVVSRTDSTIALVGAVPSMHYGNAVGSETIPIPASFDESHRVVPIPSSYEIPPRSTMPSPPQPALDRWIGVEQVVGRPDGEILIDSAAKRAVIR